MNLQGRYRAARAAKNYSMEKFLDFFEIMKFGQNSEILSQF